MRIAMLAPIAWRTPPRHYGPWETVVSLLTEGLVNRGIDTTLFATGDSVTRGSLNSVCPRGYEEDAGAIAKVSECLHISSLIEQADKFDLVHNHFDFLPLTYSSLITTPMLTTIHGFSSPGILPVYEKYDARTFYVSISDSDRAPSLSYLATIHHGIDLAQFSFRENPDDYLLYFSRIHNDKGAREAIDIAHAAGIRLLMAGIIQDADYYKEVVEQSISPGKVEYVGNVGPEARSELLGGALALLHPVQFDEPFGLSVVEAMACGTPVVAFNRGSMPELIKNGFNGFLVKNVKQAVEAIGQIGRIRRQDCRDHVERYFTVERMVDDYVGVYEKIGQIVKRESHRPWGYFNVLADSQDYKTKEIFVRPRASLSLQRHNYRAEHWLILQGEAEVWLDEKRLYLGVGDSIDIPVGAKHRITNLQDDAELRLVEVQTGSYFGEDDIERFEDAYDRSCVPKD